MKNLDVTYRYETQSASTGLWAIDATCEDEDECMYKLLRYLWLKFVWKMGSVKTVKRERDGNFVRIIFSLKPTDQNKCERAVFTIYDNKALW